MQVNRQPQDKASSDLANILPVTRVLFLPGGRKQEVLEALIASLSSAPAIGDIPALREGIFRREALLSTGIGLGVGVPHVRLDGIQDLAMAAARCQEAITDYDSLDGQPVRLVFMIAAHTSQHANHLRLLALLSRRLKIAQMRERLLAAASQAQFLHFLMDKES